MEKLDFFKQQAKLLLKDFNAHCRKSDEVAFTLMNAQHDIAQLAGFKKWNDMLFVSQEELQNGKELVLKSLKSKNKWLRTCKSCKHHFKGHDARSNYCKLNASKEEIDFKEGISSIEDLIDAPDEIYDAWQNGTLTPEAENDYLEKQRFARNKK